MEIKRLCTMKMFLSPLVPLLLLLILPDGIFSSECPKHCSCSTPESILCFQRRSSTMPKALDPSTKSLYLFANGIEGITTEDFGGLENLEMLDLSQNKLTQLPDRVFEPLTSLKNLDLSSNQITHISEECFHGMAQLERLYLYSNHIKTIHPAAFSGLEHLLELKLQGNQLTSLPTLSMPRLLLLDLRFNVLTTLGPSDLQTPNLESLKLGGVGLTSLNKDLIVSLNNLHELDISENQLESFPSALKETPGLIHLNLAGNPMGPPKVEDLQNLRELYELDISSLSLQGLPEEFSQLFPHLKKLTVAENPFNCLCHLAWFPTWLRAQSITLERTEETRCHFPLINAGKVLERLENKDFGCPTTTTVTTRTVKTTTTTISVPVTTFPTTTKVIQVPRASDNPTEEEEDLLPPLATVPPSDSNMDSDEEEYFCPRSCLNGGTCHLDQHGQVHCTCQQGTSGIYCEIKNHSLPPPPKGERPKITPGVIADTPDITSHQATATSILLDLHRYIKTRPYIRGIRLTYRNLSGPDHRPIQLSLPASLPEYTLRGLNPNSTYAVCASPLGAPSGTDSVCTEAHTTPERGPDARSEGPKLTTMLVPSTAILLLLVLIAIAVGVVCHLRRKRAKGHLELDCEPSQLELDGVKTSLDNGGLPHKQPELMISEPAVQNGSLEYEVLLLQDHCTSNNNTSSHKPSYF